jgi:hypothetical protein
MPEVFYKIRNSKGLFSTGGADPDFTKKGKVWRGIGALKNHLNLMRDTSKYDYCEVVTYELEVKEVSVKTLSATLEEIKSQRQKKHAQQVQLAQRRQEQKDRETYLTLKRRFES